MGKSYREIGIYRKWLVFSNISKFVFFQRLNIIFSTLVNTSINLQLAYYILEFQENVFSRTSRAQRHI